MIKHKVILIIVLTLNFISQSQEKVKFFVNDDFIDKKYFEIPEIETNLVNMDGKIENNLSYPHAYRFLLESDLGKYPFRKGFYFIDKSTTSIKLDTTFKACFNYAYKDSNVEYRDKFIPHYYKNSFEKCDYIIENMFFNNIEDDKNLNLYISENPDSFVALWHLIERVSFHGFSEQRKLALNNFSDNIKNSRIWKLLNEDIDRLENYSIRSIFPNQLLKNNKSKNKRISFSNRANKYTLVEFWFSKCKPCLESFDRLKVIHGNYKSKGFEIIGISTDKTADVGLWKKTLNKHNLSWQNFLDENGSLAKKINIQMYPSNFLLDQNGVIIKININPHELEGILANSL